MATKFIIETIRREEMLNVSNNLKFPCSICNKNVLGNQKAIQCDSCNQYGATSNVMVHLLRFTII